MTWTVYVCDKGHLDTSSLRGVCWACFPGGKRTWDKGQPRQDVPNQTPVEVVPKALADQLAGAADDLKLWEPGRRGYAAASRRLFTALAAYREQTG